MNSSAANFFKLATSLGGIALSLFIDPKKLEAGGQFLHKTLDAVAPNFVHQFLSVYDPVDLIKYVSGPDQLNHDIERLMTASLPKAIEQVKKKFQSEYEADKACNELFKRIAKDAADKPQDEKDILKMVTDRRAWLDDIVDYVSTIADWDKNDYKLLFVQRYLQEHLLNAFNLVFTEGLKDPADEKPLKAFLIKSLEGVSRQLTKNTELQQAILKEVQLLRADQISNSLPAAMQYFEALNEKLDRVAHGIEQANTKLDIIDKKIDKYLGQDQRQGKRAKYLNAFARYDLANLVGREQQLETIADLLKKRDLLLMHGIGGIGKTTLAKAYTSQSGNKYSHIAYVEIVGAIAESMLSQLGSLANVGLLVDQRMDLETKFKALIGTLSHIPRLLLVLDNANDPDDLRLRKQQLESLHATVLITGRAKPQSFVQQKATLEIVALTADEAMELFRSHYSSELSEKDMALVERILKGAFYHAKLVEVIAKAAQENYSLSLEGLAGIVEKKHYDDQQINFSIEVDAQTQKVYRILLDLFNTENLSEEDRQILRYFAVLPCIDIPMQDLDAILQIKDNSEREYFKSHINRLVRGGWLEETSNRFLSIHALVQWVIRQRLLPTAINCAPLVTGMASALAYGPDESPLKGQHYLQYTTEWLMLFDSDVDKELARVFSWIAVVHGAWGDYKKELCYNQKSVSIWEVVLNANDPQLAQSYNNLAAPYRNLGEHQQALYYTQKALFIREAVLPANHPLLAQSYNNLAETFRDLGDYQQALAYNHKALAIKEAVLPDRHLDFASSYNNLAITYNDLGDDQQALTYYKKALAISEAVLPADHPNLASIYNNLARAYRKLGNHHQELIYNHKALDIREAVLPANHPDLANSYTNLAATYVNLGDHQQRLSYHQKAISIWEAVLPSDHSDLASSYNSLAVTYGDIGDHKQRLIYNQKALAIREIILPANHPDLAVSYNNLAATYYQLGDFELALDYLQKAVRIRELVFPPDHPDLIDAQSGLAIIEKALKGKKQ